VKPAELMQALLDLAEEIGLEVRVVGGPRADGEPAPASAVCRVKGRVWVVLSRDDASATQIGVLARALVAQPDAGLEAPWLPPAVRDVLDRTAE